MPPTRFAGLKSVNASGVNVIDQTSPLLMDGAITIGGIRIELANSILSNATLVRNAAGDVSVNVAAGQNPAIMTFDCGGSLLKQINSLLSTTSVPAIGLDNKLADGSGDAPIAKGFKITDFTLAYSVQGVAGALTSASFRADQNAFINGANTITSLVAVGQNGIVLANTAAAATCTLTKIAVANPVFDITDNNATFAEVQVVTPANCTFRLYQVFAHVTFNYL